MTISTEELFLERERGRENREGECSVKWGLRGGAHFTTASHEKWGHLSLPASYRHLAAKRRGPNPLDTTNHGTMPTVVGCVPRSQRPLWHSAEWPRNAAPFRGLVRVLLITHTPPAPSSLATWPSKAFLLFPDLSHVSLILANNSQTRSKASRPRPMSQVTPESLDSCKETQEAALGGPCMSHKRTGCAVLFGPAMAKITD